MTSRFFPEGRLLHTSENKAASASAEALAGAMDRGTVLEGTALLCDENHDLIVHIGPEGSPFTGRIPREETALGIAEGATRDIAILSRVGKPVAFTVEALEGRDGGLFPLLSRRKAQEKALADMFSFWVPVVFALLLNQIRSNKARKTIQTISYAPYFLSNVVLVCIISVLFSSTGVVNNIIQAAGGSIKNFTSEAQYFRPLYIGSTIWQSMGFNAIIYIAALTGISPEYYEAALIDGATKWQQVKYITLPLLRPTISIMFIMNVGHIFSTDFGLFFQVTRDSNSLIDVTQTLDVYVYKALMQNNNYNYSSAVSLLQSVFGCILLIVANRVVKFIDPESGLF